MPRKCGGGCGGVFVPLVILCRTAVIADPANNQMSHLIKALPDCPTEAILFHGDGDDLTVTSGNLVANCDISNDFFTRCDNALMQA